MSKNLSDIFPPTEIGGGGGGGIEEAPRDGRMYARQEQQNTGMGWTAFDPGNLDPGTEDDQVLLWHTADDKWSASNTVPAVQSGPTPPFNPVEGTLWMEVPAQGDATMWVYTKDSGGNGRWLQHPGGKDGAPGADGNIADATEQGVVATWDDTSKQWTPEGAVVVDGGNVGIDDDSPSRKLTVKSTQSTVARVESTGSIGGMIGFADAGTSTPINPTGDPIDMRIGSIGDDFHVFTGNASRLTIDASGDATFSGRVGIHDAPVGGEFVVKVSADNKIAMNTASYAGTEVARISAFNNAVSTGVPLAIEGKDLRLRTDLVDRLTIDASGAATFSGAIHASNAESINKIVAFDGANYTALQQSGAAFNIRPQGSATIGMSMDGNGDATFSGSVTVEGNRPVTTTRDLIETLSTLRNATKDETTIKGLRDAIGNAVGGLIEKFEAMQAETQEISDE